MPCLEPFKSFYTTFDGSARTCCFTDAKHWIGQLQESTGEQIWNNGVYQSIRQHIVANQYLSSMCGACARKSAYPKQHGFQAEYNTYAKWYEHVYGIPFLADLREQVKAVPVSAAILKLHQQNSQP